MTLTLVYNLNPAKSMAIPSPSHNVECGTNNSPYQYRCKFGRTGDILKIIHTLPKIVICAKFDPKQVIVKLGISCHYANLTIFADMKRISQLFSNIKIAGK
jgi:hypothetical protein